MAILNEQDKAEVWAAFMQQLDGPVSLTKYEIKAAVEAVDSWLDVADTAIFQALPEPAASALVPNQVRDLFMLVLTKRHERLA